VFFSQNSLHELDNLESVLLSLIGFRIWLKVETPFVINFWLSLKISQWNNQCCGAGAVPCAGAHIKDQASELNLTFRTGAGAMAMAMAI